MQRDYDQFDHDAWFRQEVEQGLGRRIRQMSSAFPMRMLLRDLNRGSDARVLILQTEFVQIFYLKWMNSALPSMFDQLVQPNH